MSHSTHKLNYFFVAIFVMVFSLSLFWVATLAPYAEAAIAEQINYQGKLLTSDNIAVADGEYDMTFRLYTVLSGGTHVWTETQTITVANGLFSVMLGSSTALTGVDFAQTLYLGVNVEADGEMSPRKVLGAVPAAFEAKNAVTVGGVASSSFLRSDAADTLVASTASTLLTVTQSGVGDILNLFDGGTEVFSVLDGGNVGIGTTSPLMKLSVGGNVFVDGTLRVAGALYDSGNSAGTSGQVLQSTATGFAWVATSTLGIAANPFGSTIDPTELTATDFGAFTCNGTTCALDATYLTDISTESFLDLADTPNSYVANAILYMSGSAVTATSTFTYNGTNLSVPTNNGYAIGGTRVLSASSTTGLVTLGFGAGPNITGTRNVAVGYQALATATSTTQNVAVGYEALYGLTSGSSNIGMGYRALYENTTGSGNIAVGASALLLNINGINNLAIGNNALDSGTSTSYNTALGKSNLASLVSGNYNVTVGFDSTIYAATSSRNTIIGAESGRGVSTQTAIDDVVALGYRAGYALTTGSKNVLIGTYTGDSLSSGVNNIFLGYSAADSLTTGSNNIIIGHDIEAASSTGSNQLSIGNLLFGTGVNGTGSTLSTGNIGIGTTSPLAKLSVAGNTYLGGTLSATGTLSLLGTDANIALGSNWLSGDGGDEGVFVAGSGRVGVGTSTPNALVSLQYVATSTGLALQSTALAAARTYDFDGTSTYTQDDETILQTSNDRFYVGFSEPFNGVYLDLATPATPTSAPILVSYYNGAAFVTLAVVDETRDLTRDGMISFTPPSDWAPTTVGPDGQARYWIYINYFFSSAYPVTTATLPTAASVYSGSAFAYQAPYTTNPLVSIANNGRMTVGDVAQSAATSPVNASLHLIGSGYFNAASTNNAATLFVESGRAARQSSGTGSGILQTATVGNTYEIFYGINNMLTLGSAETYPVGIRNYITSSSTSGNTYLTAIENTILAQAGGYNGMVTTINGVEDYATGVSSFLTSSGTDAVTIDGTHTQLTLTHASHVGRGLEIMDGNSSAGTNYGVYVDVDDVDTTNYSVYVEAGSGLSYFGSRIGIGTTTPSTDLTVAGGVRITGALYDGTNSAGSAGQVLQSTGSGMTWVATSTLGLGGSGATTFLALTDTPSSYTANRLFFTNSGGSAVTDSADLTFTTYELAIGGGRSVVLNDKIIYASSTNGLIIGREAWRGTTIGNNIAIGDRALWQVTSGTSNLFIGNTAGADMTTGSYNVVFGPAVTGQYLSTGSYNVLAGYAVGAQVTDGSAITAVGMNAANRLRSTYDDTFYGAYAGFYLATTSGSVLIGSWAGAGNYTEYDADSLTLVGSHAGFNLTTGADNNTFVGFRSGNLVTTGTNNVLLGAKAGENLTIGSGNIVVGYDIDVASTTLANQLNIGNLLFGTGLDGVNSVLSTGNIGIGTTSPLAKLSVAGNTYLGGTLSATGTLSLLGTDANIALGSNWLSGDGGDEGVFVANDGKVGIGTTTPGTKLDVWGTFQVGTGTTPTLYVDTVRNMVVLGTTTPTTLSYDVPVGLDLLNRDIMFRHTSQPNRFGHAYLDSLGHMYVLASTALNFGLEGSTALERMFYMTTSGIRMNNFNGNYDTAIGSLNDTQLFYVDASADRVGIGSSTPQAKFTVAGDGFFGGNLTATGTLTVTGNTGIGTTSPSAKLGVAGTIELTLDTTGTTDNAVCWDNDGSTLLYDCDGTPADYAESYPTTPDVTYGDIVMVTAEQVVQTDGALAPRVTKADGTGVVVGITSDNYHDFTSAGQDLLAADDHPLPVALVGRVPVKVNLEGGAIAVGDRITLSSVPGVGRRASTSGEVVVGIALADYMATDTDGTVLVFVQHAEYSTVADAARRQLWSLNLAATSAEAMLAEYEAVETEDTIWRRLTRLAAGFVDGVLQVAGLRARELCLYDESGTTCINKADLDAFLDARPDSTSSTPTTALPDAVTDDSVSSDSVSLSPTDEPVVGEGEVDTAAPETVMDTSTDDEAVDTAATDTETSAIAEPSTTPTI